MIESIFAWLQGLPPIGVYSALFFVAFIENLFPPAPSDVVMLFMATLVGVGAIGFAPAVGVATAGSIIGFSSAFWIGRRFGRRVVESNRLPFLTEGAMVKVSGWFERFGYGVIVANRFLAGTRAVVAFFAGISRLRFPRTFLYASVSALAWNMLVIGLGSLLGANWRDGIMYLERYGQVVMVLLVIAVGWYLIRRRKKRRAAGKG